MERRTSCSFRRRMAPALMDAPCLNIDQYEADVPRQKKLQRRRYPFCALCRKGRQIMCIGIPMKVESLPYPAELSAPAAAKPKTSTPDARRRPNRRMVWLGTEWERKKLQRTGSSGRCSARCTGSSMNGQTPDVEGCIRRYRRQYRQVAPHLQAQLG